MRAISERRGIIETPHARLEALVCSIPERHGGACVILHPYALLGGSMADHVVSELFRAAAASHAFSLVVRYNQRGVGRSSGSMSLRGKDDQVDALAVVEWAAEQLAGHDRQVAVIGYSWGSCLAAYALSHPAVAAYVGLSFPLGGLSWVLQTKRHFGELCRASHLPRLLILGDQDQFTGLEALRQAVLGAGGAELRQDGSLLPEAPPAVAAAAGASPGGGGPPGAELKQLLLRVFPDSDHFWMSYASLAAEYAVAWLESVLLPRHQESADRVAAAAAAPAGASAAGQTGGPAAAAAPAGAAPAAEPGREAAAAAAAQEEMAAAGAAEAAEAVEAVERQLADVGLDPGPARSDAPDAAAAPYS